MRPRTDEILKSLLWTFEEYIAPETTSPYAQSLALTMKNLLRHVLLRVQLEGDLLFADNRELRALLERIVRFIANRQQPDKFADVRAEIQVVLGKTYYGADVYPSVARLVDEATDLRWALTHAITALQAARSVLGDEPEYQALRQAIRDYLGHQLEREGRMIEPAFIDQRR